MCHFCKSIEEENGEDESAVSTAQSADKYGLGNKNEVMMLYELCSKKGIKLEPLVGNTRTVDGQVLFAEAMLKFEFAGYFVMEKPNVQTRISAHDLSLQVRFRRDAENVGKNMQHWSGVLSSNVMTQIVMISSYIGSFHVKSTSIKEHPHFIFST